MDSPVHAWTVVTMGSWIKFESHAAAVLEEDFPDM